MHINSTSLIGKSNCMETTHKSQKRLTYQIYQGPHELEKAWVSCQGDGNKIIILENGEKLMEDGLEIKDPSFLVY